MVGVRLNESVLFEAEGCNSVYEYVFHNLPILYTVR